MANVQTRRNFLLTAPVAAAVALPLTDTLLRASTAVAEGGQSGVVGGGATFQVFRAQEMEGLVKGFEATPGQKDLIPPAGVAISMTVSAETKKAGKEFEYHAHRDHVFQVLDGTTKYEVGGTPKNARETKPGEWLAPESEGFTTITLNKGDYLSIPRMTPHKRITDETVSLLLISATTGA